MEHLELKTVVEVDESQSEFDRVVSTISRGDAVPLHLIESFFGVSRESENFRFAMLATKKRLEQVFLQRDPPMNVITKIDKDVGVIVLSASATSNASKRMNKSGVRKVRKAYAVQRDVPRGELAPTEVDEHDRNLDLQGRQVQALNREARRRVPEPKPVKRQTPAKKI